MPATTTTTTGRNWIARILAVAMLGTLLGVSGLPGTPSAGALDLAICDNPLNTGALVLPQAVADGTTFGTYRTTWNTTFFSPQPGVLANDGFLFDGEVVPEPEGRFQAILLSQPAHGTVQLRPDGSWSYTPIPDSPTPPPLTDSFQYLVYDTGSSLCSSATNVYIRVEGFTDVPADKPPTAIGDRFPVDPDTGAVLSIVNTETLTVPAPGVLANDKNSFDPDGVPGLAARVSSPPVWVTNGRPAGQLVDWGKRTEQGLTVFDESGGFTFIPDPGSYGTAMFTYRACYAAATTNAGAPCSEPVPVLIDVTGETGARPFQRTLGADGTLRITAPEFAEHSTVDSNGSGPWLEVISLSSGTFFNETVRPAGNSPDRYFFAFNYTAGPDFDGRATITYRMCNSNNTGPARVCTNESTITVVAPPPAPVVSSVVAPTTRTGLTGAVDIRFDRPVKGITGANTLLQDVTDPLNPTVPANVICWVEIPQKDPLGSPVIGPDGQQKVERQVQSCADGSVGLVTLVPTSPLTDGRSYRLRVNNGSTGITSSDTAAVPLTPYEQTFVFRLADTSAPTASPSASVAAGTWSRNDVTVDWNWSDGTGTGVDPSRCTTSSTSSGAGVQLLTAQCTDRRGNVGGASYEVKVDKSAPQPNPVYSPAVNQGWASGPVTVTWNWTDAGIGIDPAKCPATSTLAGEGLLLILETCTDLLGNTGFGAAQAFIDEVAPTASPTFSSPPGPSGWYTTKPLTITWNWTDAGSGLDPANCPPTSTVLSDGASLVPATCKDVAGNVGRAGGIYYVDSTAPTARPVVTPRPFQGWSNGPVTITWNWDDLAGTGSGIDPARCPATSSASTSGTVTASCTDIAGNTATASQRVDIETTAPTASPVVPSGWSRSDVTVPWNWTDTGGSGLDTTTCPLSSRSAGEGTITLTAGCSDIAGNRATASAEVKVDATAPTLAPTVTPNPVLLNGTAAASANATDATSGIATQGCAAPRTTALGPATVACTATDVAGNTATATAPYVVGVGIKWTNRPSSIWPDAGLATGVTVQLTDAAGKVVPSTVASRLGTCAVRFRLADQTPVCASYIALTNTFAAFVPTTRKLTAGTTVNLTATVTTANTLIGTATVPVRVVRR